jgi:hypothetical protein
MNDGERTLLEQKVIARSDGIFTELGQNIGAPVLVTTLPFPLEVGQKRDDSWIVNDKSGKPTIDYEFTTEILKTGVEIDTPDGMKICVEIRNSEKDNSGKEKEVVLVGMRCLDYGRYDKDSPVTIKRFKSREDLERALTRLKMSAEPEEHGLGGGYRDMKWEMSKEQVHAVARAEGRWQPQVSNECTKLLDERGRENPDCIGFEHHEDRNKRLTAWFDEYGLEKVIYSPAIRSLSERKALLSALETKWGQGTQIDGEYLYISGVRFAELEVLEWTDEFTRVRFQSSISQTVGQGLDSSVIGGIGTEAVKYERRTLKPDTQAKLNKEIEEAERRRREAIKAKSKSYARDL